MARFAVSISLLLGFLSSTSGADRSWNGREDAAARRDAAKKCEIDLRDATEAFNNGRVNDAERCLKKARALAETVGPQSLEMADSLEGLGILATFRKEYDRADSLLSSSLTIKEKVLLPDDLEIGRTLHYLALNTLAHRKYADAEPIANRALAIRENAPQVIEEQVADTLDVLSSIYAYQDKIQKADEVFQRAVEIREKVQGVDHPDLARALMNMAVARVLRAFNLRIKSMINFEAESQPNAAEAEFRVAERMMQRALKIREKSLGLEHPDTIQSIEQLMNCYRSHDDNTHSDPLLRRLLAIREKALGPDSTKVAEILAWLSIRASEQGKYRNAETSLRRAVAIQQKACRADPDDKTIRETEEGYAASLRRAVRSADVMEDPSRRPSEDDLKYLNGLLFSRRQPDVISLFNLTDFRIVDHSVNDAGLAHLRELVNLEFLSIRSRQITDEGLVHLRGLTDLRYLTLLASLIHGPGLAHLKGMTDLERLDLEDSHNLDDDGLAHLPCFPRLKVLNLSHTNISDKGLDRLNGLAALTELNLDDTKVTEAGIKEFKRARPGLKVFQFRPTFVEVPAAIPRRP